MRAAAKAKGVITQMGNQGHANEGTRLLKEWCEAGVLGDVREVTAWSPTLGAQAYTRPDRLPLPVEAPPKTLDWNLWLGPAEERPYHPSLAPMRWRGWWAFGNGMLGDWGCHTLDAPFWALELGAPSVVEARVSEVSAELTPPWAEVTFRFPARGTRPPVTMKWLEGAERMPSPPPEFDLAQNKSGLARRGMLMSGSRNTLYAPGGRCESPLLLPDAVMQDFKKRRPPATIPRVIGGPFTEWIDAIAGKGPLPGSNFEYAAPLAELVLLGALAVRTGQRIEWDATAGRVTNNPALNRYVAINAREGWRV